MCVCVCVSFSLTVDTGGELSTSTCMPHLYANVWVCPRIDIGSHGTCIHFGSGTCTYISSQYIHLGTDIYTCSGAYLSTIFHDCQANTPKMLVAWYMSG